MTKSAPDDQSLDEALRGRKLHDRVAILIGRDIVTGVLPVCAGRAVGVKALRLTPPTMPLAVKAPESGSIEPVKASRTLKLPGTTPVVPS